MSAATKRSFQLVLKSNNTPFITTKDTTFIGNVSMSWFPLKDYVTFRDNRFSIFSFNTPIATPATLLKKLIQFRSMIKKLESNNGFRNVPFQTTNYPK